MGKSVRKAYVRAGRMSGGKGTDKFSFEVVDIETHASVEVVLTPEQWALALWGRGDVEVDATWSGAEVTAPALPAPGAPRLPSFAAKKKAGS